MSSKKMHPIVTQLGIVVVILVGLVSVAAGQGCGNTACTPAPVGVQCTQSFERGGCCPVWHCSNGQTVYGMSSSDGSSSGSGTSYSWSSSSSSGSGGAAVSGLLSGLLGGMFGRR